MVFGILGPDLKNLFQQLEQFLERRPKCSCKFQNMNLADKIGMEYEYDTL